MRDSDNPKRWAIDEEGAAVVRMIYAMRLNGVSVNDIAQKLRRRRVLTPSAYAVQKGFTTRKISVRGEFFWGHPIVRDILSNRAYLGDVVNFRTTSRSYKLKQRIDNPEEKWEIHEAIHDPAIDRASREAVQKTFGSTKIRKPKTVEERNMFSGLLICSECGAHLNYKFTHDNPEEPLLFLPEQARQQRPLCHDTPHPRGLHPNPLILTDFCTSQQTRIVLPDVGLRLMELILVGRYDPDTFARSNFGLYDPGRAIRQSTEQGARCRALAHHVHPGRDTAWEAARQ